MPAALVLPAVNAVLPAALDFRVAEAVLFAAVDADCLVPLVLRAVDAVLPAALDADCLAAPVLLALDAVLPVAVVFRVAEPDEAALSFADTVLPVVLDLRAVEVVPFFAAGFSLSRKRSVSRFRGDAVDFFFSVIVPLRMNFIFKRRFALGATSFLYYTAKS